MFSSIHNTIHCNKLHPDIMHVSAVDRHITCREIVFVAYIAINNKYVVLQYCCSFKLVLFHCYLIANVWPFWGLLRLKLSVSISADGVFLLCRDLHGTFFSWTETRRDVRTSRDGLDTRRQKQDHISDPSRCHCHRTHTKKQTSAEEERGE